MTPAMWSAAGGFLGGAGMIASFVFGVWQHNRTQAKRASAEKSEIEKALQDRIIDDQIAKAIGTALEKFEAKVTARFNHNDDLTNALATRLTKIEATHFGNGIGLRGMVDKIDGEVGQLSERVARIEGSNK